MIRHVLDHTLPAAYAVLPEPMDMARADVQLLAIGLQESGFRLRRQWGPRGPGPARGFWQFEVNGIYAVLTHSRTRAPLLFALDQLRYGSIRDNAIELHKVVEHNDTVAAVFARLMLWTLPGALATTPGGAWSQYLAAWRPGAPKPNTWEKNFDQASALVMESDHDA